MNLLGARLKQRRKQLGLRQKDVAGESASFLSKVEGGTAQPSLANLTTWSKALDTTAGNLLGDHLVLEAAKQSILLTDKCLHYLDQLPQTESTKFLRQLTISATSISTPVPTPPTDPELEYLTAKVLVHRSMLKEAQSLLAQTLKRSLSNWRIHHLSLLCQIYESLGEQKKKDRVLEDLRRAMEELDYEHLIHALPEGEYLTSVHLDLLKLSYIMHHKKRITG